MFVRTDAGEDRASDQASGLGVGLALARQMVEMHGGSLVAHSEGVGRGAEFVIRLPLMSAPRPASAAARDGGSAAPHGGTAAPHGGAATLDSGAAALDDGGSETAPAAALSAARRRILIVEDNLDTACALSTLLELSGHETQTVYEGATAIERAESFRPDVILLDIGLPGMSGYDVCRAIRARPWGQRMRIVALSGWGKENDRRRAAEAGFDDHLLKPAAPGAIATALAKAR
jgi:CheY-like chemotaxis protein